MSLPTNFFIGRGGGPSIAFSADSMDLSILINSRQTTSASPTTGAGGLYVDPNGYNLFTFDASTVRKYTMSTAHDLTTLSGQVDYYQPPNYSGNRAMGFSHDGTKMFLVEEVGHTIYKYNMQPWNISGAGGGGSYGLSQVNGELYPHSLRFDPTGYKMNVQWWQTGTDRLHHYTMQYPYDPGSRTLVSSADYNGSTVRNMDWSDDGTFMAYAESGSGKLRCYYLSTPWDVSTMYGYQEYANFVPFSVEGVFITGNYLYICGANNIQRFNV